MSYVPPPPETIEENGNHRNNFLDWYVKSNAIVIIDMKDIAYRDGNLTEFEGRVGVQENSALI